jgi:hypothetical protein
VTGASNWRATLIPCGSRPSTAALTRLGARKASEICHIDVALIAGLPRGDTVDRRCAGLDLGQPLAFARNRGNELDPSVGADWKGWGSC